MKYAAVVFDLFGTLVDNPPYERYLDVLRRMALILSVPFDDLEGYGLRLPSSAEPSPP